MVVLVTLFVTAALPLAGVQTLDGL
jgi:hypothetical protein